MAVDRTLQERIRAVLLRLTEHDDADVAARAKYELKHLDSTIRMEEEFRAVECK